jgi:hypothetical protein
MKNNGVQNNEWVLNAQSTPSYEEVSMMHSKCGKRFD